MANTLVNPSWVTFEVAKRFVNSLRAVNQFTRKYEDEYSVKGAKVGDTVRVRLPQQFEVSEGEGLVEQNLNDQTKTLIINRRRQVGMGWSSTEATINIDDMRERYILPAADHLANAYDRAAMADVYKSVFNAVGTLGTTPSAALTYGQAKVKIQDLAGPDTGLRAVLEPLAHVTLADAHKALFHPGSLISKATKTGMIAEELLGIAEWYTDQNVPRFTSGAVTVASTPLVNGAGQTGSSIITDGWGSGGLAAKKGDIITIGGVRSVNPVSKESTGRLQQFVLTADATDTTGAATLSISPSIITSGALQNVDAAPADNAVITYWGMAPGGTHAATVSPQNLVFHPEAFATVMVDLVMPNGGAKATRVQSRDLNIAIRFVEQYGIQDDRNRSRLDILFGNAPIQERMATRVVG